MVFWGFILAVAALLTVLVTFLSSLNIFSDMSALGMGAWFSRFFAPEYLTGKKISFFIALVLLVVGVIMFFVGRARAAKSGESDAKTEKSVKFLRDLKGEFKKITWPTLPSVVRNTGVTLALCAVFGAIICLIDLALGQLVKLLLTM
ncbi:MAG: preprotein translocase subunit SecE [Clostridia bacterium]|nr:preprotein translocase subunit SecE [Clostridia bacterium]